MPKLAIIKSNIVKMPLITEKGKTVDYWDTGDGSLKGFGVRCNMESRSFFVQCDVRKPDGSYKTVKSVIGKYPTYTCEEARIIAKERLFRLKQGEDAIKEKPITFRELIAKHIESKNYSPSTIRNYNMLTTKLNSWIDLPIDEVAMLEPDIVLTRYQEICKEYGAYAAKACFISFQAVMNNGLVRYPKFIKRNPCEIITQTDSWQKSNVRTDCLKGNDFKQFYDGISRMNDVIRDAFLVCLYTGMRKEEAASLQWSYIDFENATLHIPTTKNGLPLYIPLSSQVMNILQSRQSLNASGSLFVFPTQSGLNKNGFVYLNAVNLKLKTKLDITVHGLHRSFVDIADNKLHLRRQDVDRLTNHVDVSVTGKHYSHKDVEDLRSCIQSIGNEIERLMLHGVGAKVVELATARKTA